MIETIQDVERFKSENANGDLILHIVSVDDGLHPCNNSPCILFVRNISTGNTYYYSFNHPDSHPSGPVSQFIHEIFINFPNEMWALDAKAFKQFLSIPKIKDINICSFLKYNEILSLGDFETTAHHFVRKNSYEFEMVNKIIPLMKHKETFDAFCIDAETIIDNFKRGGYDTSYSKFNALNHILGDLESSGVFVDPVKFKKHFDASPNKNGLVFSQYNVYTSTGRPSNRFGGINYAALNHSDGSRECFVSRYGNDGRMVVIDYSAFHPRIISKLTNCPIASDVDVYEYLAKLYFQKKEVDEIDIKEAKKLTFRQLYGGVEEKYSHIKYLANLKTFIDEQWGLFQSNGYIETPWFRRRITTDHIKDPNPTKLFNYILQAAEGEVAIPQIESVVAYLKGKKTKAVFYTYDAVLYDFHKDDGIDTLNFIRKLMSANGCWPTKTYIGNSYHDLKLFNI